MYYVRPGGYTAEEFQDYINTFLAETCGWEVTLDDWRQPAQGGGAGPAAAGGGEWGAGGEADDEEWHE
jgi:hypothetical protein